MPRRVKLPYDKGAIKALVVLFGPREAARQAGLKEQNVLKMAQRNGWKKAVVKEAGYKDAGDMIAEAISNSKKLSTAHLAKFTERAAIEASELEHPLEGAKDVRHVAHVYNVLWPHVEKATLIEGSILIGGAVVEDVKSVEEVKDARAGDVRKELSDGGLASD